MSERLTRGLAEMLMARKRGLPNRYADISPGGEADALVATPIGKALAALVEAAEAWSHTPGWTQDAALRERLDSDLGLAVAAWLAATEPRDLVTHLDSRHFRPERGATLAETP